MFQALVAGVTVVMVFVIQHTQARHQAATQRKLDEILRVLPEADNSLLAVGAPAGGGNGIQPMAAAMISCACFWIAARSSGPRKDSA